MRPAGPTLVKTALAGLIAGLAWFGLVATWAHFSAADLLVTESPPLQWFLGLLAIDLLCAGLCALSLRRLLGHEEAWALRLFVAVVLGGCIVSLWTDRGTLPRWLPLIRLVLVPALLAFFGRQPTATREAAS